MNAVKARENNFGLLRLVFASLVIFAHSPELLDGDRSRELLTRIFGTLSFGEIAVDGFFLVSGFLITKSFVQSSSITSYFFRRILRIVPGYLVSFWICVLVIAPLVGAGLAVFSAQSIFHEVIQCMFLLQPMVPGAFVGLPHDRLNGAMWTIAYEFRCYLILAAIGYCGLLEARYRVLIAILTVALLLLDASQVMDKFHIVGNTYVGTPINNIHFFAVFFVGALFYLFQDTLRLGNWGAIGSAVALAVLLFSHRWADTGFAVFGGYLTFWFALRLPVFDMSRHSNRTDISYGLYLYAWPIQNLIIWGDRDINPWLLSTLTLAAAAVAAYASWVIVEKPCLAVAHQLTGIEKVSVATAIEKAK
jgi:peptidoglycan/LPS O-acetylase OafA/YrhL